MQEILRYIIPGEDIIVSDRDTLKDTECDKQEIDIYIPSRKLAIEFNGDYWHSNIFKDINYHKNKTDACKNKGIQLVHIFEHEWNDEETKEKLIDYLMTLLGKNKRIYARNCEISTVNKDEATRFINDNHLQRSTGFSIALGLYSNSELISVMTFGKPRFNNEYQYELIRYCTKRGISITGGAEKIFKKFIEDYKPESIISYCDKSKFTGKVYSSLGFINDGDTYPNYIWESNDMRHILTRYQTQKNKLIELGFGTYGDTEDEIMKNLGYMKIYDCGNTRFVWITNKNIT